MTRIAWERYEGNDIEAVVAMLVNREFPSTVRVTPSKGDGGVDILDRRAAANGGDVVYQVKRHTKPLTTGQQSKVEVVDPAAVGPSLGGIEPRGMASGHALGSDARSRRMVPRPP